MFIIFGTARLAYVGIGFIFERTTVFLNAKAWRPCTRSSTETDQPVPTAPIFGAKIAAEKVANLQGTRSHNVFALSEPI